MLARIVEEYADLPKFARKAMWRIWHNLIIRSDGQPDDAAITLMNYGYASLNGSAPLALKPEDEDQRYCINLYHKTASRIDLTGKHVLEVGCGRGGGASYIARYLGPSSCVGLDLSENATAFCNQHHREVRNLKFAVGEAERIPFPAEFFDAVVNVESSRAYPCFAGFLGEVYRVLRPGGSLLISDLRWAKDVDAFKQAIRDASFEVRVEENISQHVVKALEVDNPRRKQMIRQKLPRFLVKSFDEFAGVKGSGRYRTFSDGSMQYLSVHAVKPE